MKKILIVDDDPDISSNIKYMLEKANYKVIVASDGSEAIAKATYENPHLIIMDLMLPGIQGAEAVNKIKTIPSCADIPVVFLTGLVSRNDDEDIKTINIDNKPYPVFAKPFNFPRLLNSIERALE